MCIRDSLLSPSTAKPPPCCCCRLPTPPCPAVAVNCQPLALLSPSTPNLPPHCHRRLPTPAPLSPSTAADTDDVNNPTS
eukprot:7887056-Pyramimonas_sp.AAC.1